MALCLQRCSKVIKRLRRLLLGRERPDNPPDSLAAGIVVAAQASSPLLASEAFTPTQPRSERSGLIGRKPEMEMIVQRLLEDKAHVVLYSERGMGKTSLANSIVDLLRRGGVFVARYQCEANSTFDSLMRGLTRTVPGTLLAAPARPDPLEGCEAVFPPASIRPENVVALLPRLRLPSLVCVIDEVDRILDAETRTMLADTMKQLSDRGVPLLFMLIGVSDSLEQLLGEHPSIQRALVGVPLPLLSDDDIAAIVDRGARQAGLTFPHDLVAAVARTARGMPYLAHLLGLRAAQVAARRSTREISPKDFVVAVEQLLMETPLHVVQRFNELTNNGQDASMRQALDLIACCEQDRWGRIRVLRRSSEQMLVGGQPATSASWDALCKAGVLRPCKGAAEYVTVAHRGLHQYQTLRLAAEDCRATAGIVGGERPALWNPALAEMAATPLSPRQSFRG